MLELGSGFAIGVLYRFISWAVFWGFVLGTTGVGGLGVLSFERFSIDDMYGRLFFVLLFLLFINSVAPE